MSQQTVEKSQLWLQKRSTNNVSFRGGKFVQILKSLPLPCGTNLVPLDLTTQMASKRTPTSKLMTIGKQLLFIACYTLLHAVGLLKKLSDLQYFLTSLNFSLSCWCRNKQRPWEQDTKQADTKQLSKQMKMLHALIVAENLSLKKKKKFTLHIKTIETEPCGQHVSTKILVLSFER